MKILERPEKPDRLVFLEERSDAILWMTLNAYKNYHTAYLKEKANNPKAQNDVDHFNKTVSPKERERRRQERLDFAMELGFQFGASRKVVDSRFDNMSRDIRSLIEEGVTRGLSSPYQELDPFQSKLLILRARAFSKGRFCDLDMTPEDLKALTPAFCPILGTRLAISGHDPLHPDERHQWSVERMCNSLGYAKENIAVISTAANIARNNLDAEAILERAAGKVVDEQLTQIQWCRLFNHHFASLRLENPHLRKRPPPITWKAPRYSSADIRQIAAAIADPHAPSDQKIPVSIEALAFYFEASGRNPKDAVRQAKEFQAECDSLSWSVRRSEEVNLIALSAMENNVRMLEEIGKEVFGSDYKESMKYLGEADHRIISKASSAGYAFRP